MSEKSVSFEVFDKKVLEEKQLESVHVIGKVLKQVSYRFQKRIFIFNGVFAKCQKVQETPP